MIRTTGTRFAALALSVAAGIGLVGCGNGLQVRGPSKPPSAPVSSPGSGPTSATSPSGKATHSPGTTAGDRTSKPAKSSAPSRGQTGSHSGGKDQTGGNQAGGNQAGGNQAGGSQTTPPPDNGGQQSGQATIGKCGLGDLHAGVRVPAGGGAAGSQYVLLTFTNISPQRCTMYGYAGVSFVGHQNGTQLGKPAVRDRSRSSQTVRLAPGSTKAELLQITDAGNFDPKTCQPTTSDGFRVYPPDSYTAAYVPFKTSACQGDVAQLTVYPVGTRS